MSEEGKTADRLGDVVARAYSRSRGELEPVRFTTSHGRTLTPRELVYVVLHVPVELARYAQGVREAIAHWIPVGAR